jgi:hypothetical protein
VSPAANQSVAEKEEAFLSFSETAPAAGNSRRIIDNDFKLGIDNFAAEENAMIAPPEVR